MTHSKFLLLIFLVALMLSIIFQNQIGTHTKIILFITEEFPQIPIKPLGFLTQKPQHNKIELQSSNGRIVGDLFIPEVSSRESAVILTMGVKLQDKDRNLLLHFAEAMARLGFIVFWPRLDSLDRGISLPEEPETFIEAFKYLENLPSVDPNRISYVGFSVGSSTAFVASSHHQIRDKVHGLVFFGGFYDVFDYLLALEGGDSWEAHQDAINHAKALLVAKGVASASADYRLGPDAGKLKKYSPAEHLDSFHAKIFILHDKSDEYVSYTQSVKLYQAMPADQIGAYHISDLFDHVQPNRPINLGELVKLYGFLYKVFGSL